MVLVFQNALSTSDIVSELCRPDGYVVDKKRCLEWRKEEITEIERAGCE